MIVGGAGLISLDRHVERWIIHHRVEALDHVFVFLSRIGTFGLVWIGLALVAAILWRQPLLFGRVLVADTIAGVAQFVIKRLVGRPRPPAVLKEPSPLVYVPSSPSFPSGHATASFACAVVLARAAPRLAWPPIFVLAALVSFSRDYVGVHYPLDSIAGAALGTAIGFGVLTALRPLEAARRRSRRSR